MEPDRCCLARVDFLGAMEVDLWGISENNTKKMREEGEKAEKWLVEGKTFGRTGFFRAQNICRFAVAKGSLQRQRVSTQRCRDLRCCVPESGQGAT